MGGGMLNGIGGLGTFGLIGMILNLVITIGVMVGIVLLIVWLVRKVGAGNGQATWARQQSDAPASPRDILQIRYARGEITREQYQQMLADLAD